MSQEYEIIGPSEIAKYDLLIRYAESKSFFGLGSDDEIRFGEVIVRRHTFKPTAEGEPLISITKGGLTSYCDTIDIVELGRGRFRFDFLIHIDSPIGAIPVHTGNVYVRVSPE